MNKIQALWFLIKPVNNNKTKCYRKYLNRRDVEHTTKLQFATSLGLQVTDREAFYSQRFLS